MDIGSKLCTFASSETNIKVIVDEFGENCKGIHEKEQYRKEYK